MFTGFCEGCKNLNKFQTCRWMDKYKENFPRRSYVPILTCTNRVHVERKQWIQFEVFIWIKKWISIVWMSQCLCTVGWEFTETWCASLGFMIEEPFHSCPSHVLMTGRGLILCSIFWFLTSLMDFPQKQPRKHNYNIYDFLLF